MSAARPIWPPSATAATSPVRTVPGSPGSSPAPCARIATSRAGTTPPRAKKEDDSTYTDKSGKVFRITIPTKLNQTSTSDLKVDVTSGSNYVEIAIDEDGTTQVKS